MRSSDQQLSRSLLGRVCRLSLPVERVVLVPVLLVLVVRVSPPLLRCSPANDNPRSADRFRPAVDLHSLHISCLEPSDGSRPFGLPPGLWSIAPIGCAPHACVLLNGLCCENSHHDSASMLRSSTPVRPSARGFLELREVEVRPSMAVHRYTLWCVDWPQFAPDILVTTLQWRTLARTLAILIHHIISPFRCVQLAISCSEFTRLNQRPGNQHR